MAHIYNFQSSTCILLILFIIILVHWFYSPFDNSVLSSNRQYTPVPLPTPLPVYFSQGLTHRRHPIGTGIQPNHLNHWPLVYLPLLIKDTARRRRIPLNSNLQAPPPSKKTQNVFQILDLFSEQNI
jgi:hypothetical protein